MSSTGSPPGATLRAVIYASRRLDELSTARIIEHVAETVHKQQKGGHALGNLTPDAIFVGSEAIELRSGPPKSDYTAPETTGGKQGDRRSDVFSLGAILWEALAHERRTAGAFQPPSELNANVPPELDVICKKALAHDPAQRYPSTKVMAAEIATVLDDAGYPDDLSQVSEYIKTAFSPVSAGAALAAKLAATPTGSQPPLARPDGATPKAALNQTMMGVAPSAVQEALRAAKAAEQKAKDADPTSVAFAGLPEETRAKAASSGPLDPLSFVSKTGTMPPPNATVTPASTPAVAADDKDVPLAAPPGPPNQTAPGGWTTGTPPASAPSTAPPAPATSAAPASSGAPASSEASASPASASSAAPASSAASASPASESSEAPASPASASSAAPASPASASGDAPAAGSIASANPMQTLPFGSKAISQAEIEAAAKSETAAKSEAAQPADAPRAKTPSSGPKLPGLPPEPDAAKSEAAKSEAAKSEAAKSEAAKSPASIASAETVATPALVPTAAPSAAPVLDVPAPGSGLVGLPSLPPGAEAAVTVAEQPTAPVKQRAATSPGRTRAPSDSGVDPASAVSLPFRARRDSQGDMMLEKWASTGDSLEADDGHESDIIEEQRKQRKRLIVVSSGALAAILLTAIVALAFGGKDKPKPKTDETTLSAPSPTAGDPTAKPTDSDVSPTAGVDPNAGSADPNAGADPTEMAAGSAEQGSADDAAAEGSGSAEAAVATAGSADAAAAAAVAERLAAEQAAAEKAAAEKAAAEAAAADAAAKAEQARLAKEEAAQKAAEEKAAKAEQARLAKEAKAEQQRIAREEAAKKAAEKKAAQAAAAKKEPKKKAAPKQTAAAPIDPYAEPKRPVGDPAALYKQGFQQYVRGDSSGALSTFKNAQQANPGYAPTYRGLGLVYEKMGQKDKAKIAFKKYLQLSPNAGDADQIRERLARL